MTMQGGDAGRGRAVVWVKSDSEPCILTEPDAGWTGGAAASTHANGDPETCLECV